MKYNLLQLAVLATLTATSAQASQDMPELGEGVPTVITSDVDRSDSLPLTNKQSVFIKSSPVDIANDLSKQPDYFISAGVQNFIGINNKVKGDSEGNMDIGLNLGFGFSVEDFDVQARYQTSSSEFGQVTRMSNIDINAMNRIINEDNYQVKVGLGYNIYNFSGDDIDFQDGDDSKSGNGLTTASGYAAIGLKASLTPNWSIGTTARYHVFKEDHSINVDVSRPSSNEAVFNDISFQVETDYRITDRVGVSFTYDFGSEFQKSLGINAKIGF